MTRRRGFPRPTWPMAGMLLYAIGLVTVLAVALTLGDGETTPERWALTLVPVTLFAAASVVVRRTERAQRRHR
jgi:hypothetical protein